MKQLKIFVATFILGAIPFSQAISQEHIYNWSSPLGSNQDEIGKAITSDLTGNVISAGYFRNTIDFDLGAGTTNLTAAGGADIFVQKQDAAGNLIWAAQMGGIADDVAEGVVVDAAGNVYAIGYFTGTVDFDPGAGTQNLTSSGSNDIFIVKLDVNGNYVWAHNIGSTGNDVGRNLELDGSGNIYFTGFFSGTVDFDPGAGVSNLSSNGQADFFVLKLDPSGNHIWSKSIGGTGNDDGFGISVDAFGNTYTTGYFNLTVDFDPNVGVQNLTGVANDIFLVKLDANGNYVWANSFGAGSFDYANDVEVDNSGMVIITGRFAGTIDFDPGAGTANVASVGGFDIFVAKYDQNGQYQWAKGFGSSLDEEGSALSFDAANNVFATGFFRGTADFDPGVGTSNLSSNGNADVFILKLDNNGNYAWAKKLGGTLNDHGHDINYDVNNAINITGYYNATVDFDLGTGTSNATSAGGSDIFILNLKECFITSSTQHVASCTPFLWIDGNTYSTSNNTATHTLTNVGGCDSIVTLNLTYYDINDETVTLSASTFCDNGNSTISIASSQCDVKYYLRDNANDTIVDGPLMGNGGSLDFTTGNITQSMTYNIYAEVEEENGVDFEGVNLDRLQVSNPFFTYGSELTVEAWVNFDASINDVPWMGQAQIGADFMSSNVWLWHNANGVSNDITFFVNDNQTWRAVQSTGLTALTGWHYISTTADASGLNIYIDGVLDATSSTGISTGIQNSANSGIHLGGDPRYPNDPNRHGTYGLSEVKVWSVSKSQLEIQNGMTGCLNGNEADLVYYNKINDGSGAVATAITGNNANFSAGMNPATDWNSGYLDLQTTCDLEMSQLATVTVNQSTTATQTVTNCVSYTWPENSTMYTTTGMYTTTIPNAAGCDSLITLDLTITSPTTSAFNAGGCVSYTVPSGDETYTLSGVYNDTIPNTAGCDSVMTITVTIGASPATISETACFMYTVPSGDETYTVSGMYNDTIPSMGGCDSIITINLTINTVNISTTTADPSIMANAAGAVYQWLDCNNGNAALSGQTSQNFTATSNGSYAVKVTENGCTDTSACVDIVSVGFEGLSPLEVSIYPNPTNGEVWINIPELGQNTRVAVYSLDGKQILETSLQNQTELIDLTGFASGYYTIKVSNDKESFISKIRLF